MAATVHGIAIRPRVSRNGRRYTPETLKKAYDRLNRRLADTAARPVTMRTFHPKPGGQDGNVTSIVGHVTKASLTSDGAIAYEAVLADTDEAKAVQKLVKPGPDGRQHLGNVSIRGWWLGPTETDENGFETGDDLEIDGLDLTDSPGIPEATVALGANGETGETAGRTFIFESAEAFVDMTITESGPAACLFEDGLCTTCQVTEAANKTPYGDVTYADPGYQSDKKKRYPIDTKAHTKAAWSYINKAGNEKPYTSAQLKRIKQRIKAAAKKFGIDITAESYDVAVKQIVEAYAAMLPETARPKFVEEASACVSVGNGPANISVSAYGNDPADLQAVIGRLSAAVVAALDAVDPDGDGDIDLPGDADGGAGWRETAPGVKSPAHETAPAAAQPKGAPMSTETTPAAGTEATPVTAESVATAVTAALAAPLTALAEAVAKLAPAAPATETAAGATTETGPAEGAPAAGTTETASAKPKTEAEIREALKAEIRNEMLNESRNSGGEVERKGLAAKITAEDFDLSSLPESDRRAIAGEAYFKRLFPAQHAALADV
jgi:hypothetical protein